MEIHVKGSPKPQSGGSNVVTRPGKGKINERKRAVGSRRNQMQMKMGKSPVLALTKETCDLL